MVSTLDLFQSLLGLYRNGQTHPIAWESGPPPRIDGYVIGTPVMSRPAPHNGEMHPDGDEVLLDLRAGWMLYSRMMRRQGWLR